MKGALNIEPSDKKRVVIVGGGFGGVALVRNLRGCGMQVVLIDDNNYHQFQPLLYQVATSGLEPTAISFPLRRLLRGYKDFYYRMARAISVDSKNSVLITSIGDIGYDYLVIAAGATTAYYGMNDVERNSLPLKSVGQALNLRNTIYRTMEAAIRCDNEGELCRTLNFVIVGGGPTGVELAGAVAELKKKILPKDYPEIDFTKMRVVLLNASDRLLESFSPKSSARAQADLSKMGVEVICGAKVEGFDGMEVVYNGKDSIWAKNVVWASGVKANRIEGIEAVGRGGRITVDEFNRVAGSENIFAIGDIAIMENDQYPAGHPGVAQVAIQQGGNVAKNFVAAARNLALKPFVYKDKGSMATIGRNKAVVELGRFKVYGFWAWVMWLFVHLMFILGTKNRFTALWDWSWSYITHEQPLRSIIESKQNN